MLKLIDITKEYKVDEESVLALHGIDIEFRKNEFVSILGPSGCGKTTLLNIIGGLDRYTSGDIQIDGISTKEYDDIDWDTYRNRRIGFVFQSYNLIPHMNILNNVAMSLTLAGIGKDERKKRAMDALRKVGLETQAKKRPNQLSGGQMQRVAIARALVNNPDIILADEPTGALDSESGIQVMDLLKEVAEDRLVIMVTHNSTLAEEYSTRIVYLKDGEKVGDTMPFDSAAEAARQPKTEIVLENDDSEAIEGEGKAKKPRKERKLSRFQLHFLKAREHDKSSMSIKTAISLSFNNLLSKKGRTLLTSIAGSIGIIGIILVLSLSSGVSQYVKTIEENALSQYPIQINQTNMDFNTIMNILAGSTSDRPEYPDSDIIHTQPVLGEVMGNLDVVIGENNLESLKAYLDENFDERWGQIKYGYGTTFDIYRAEPITEEESSKNAGNYIKVSPFSDVMGDVIDGLGGLLPGGSGNELLNSLKNLGSMIDSWDEMSSNYDLLNQQYDLLGNSRWPSEGKAGANEIVVVLDNKNQLNDYTLFMLGLKTADELGEALMGGGFGDVTYTVDELLGMEYMVYTNTDYFSMFDTENGYYEAFDKKRSDNKEFIESTKDDAIPLRVVGVVRPKKGAVVTSINSVVGYTHALTELTIERAQQSPVVSAQYQAMQDGNGETYTSVISYTYKDSRKADDNITTITAGQTATIGQDNGDFEELMRALGVVDLDKPKNIKIYCSTFEDKDKITALLTQYGEEEGNKPVKYTDYLEMIMGYVGTLTTTVTGVLVGFSAISLLVSTIMIAIIIYTSVLERRKEIGVLRSLGARKKDISRVFLAESSMIGLYSGIIGLIISAILAAIANAVLLMLFGIAGLAQIEWWHCVMMLLISLLLSMFAGFIPSRIAANKDPAIALRSE